MDRTMRIGAIIRHIETHIKEDIGYSGLEKAVGLSYRQLREDFRACTGKPLKQYILSRKIAYAAFDMETTQKTLLHIANDYSFGAYDTFTRAFRREVGVPPGEYRKSGCRKVRRKLIGMGTYAPVIEGAALPPSVPASPGDAVLYGVPRVEYATGKCTPFPACLESLLTYMGQRENCSYAWLSAATGMAFRLCWSQGKWDAGAVDIANLTPSDPWEVYRRAFRAAGWACNILTREEGGEEQFAQRIRASIGQGRPAIALGVVGPPEACIVTGFREAGRVWLGWSYFQDNPEFASHGERGEAGYFQTSRWWDNPATQAVITLGEPAGPPGLRDIIGQIHAVLTADSAGSYQTGQRAYESWAKDLLDDKAFATRNITPILLSRFFCQADGETMIGEGRHWAARFFRQLGDCRPALSRHCRKAAVQFESIAAIARRMTELRRGTDQTEESVLLLCDAAIRTELAALVRQAQSLERNATATVEDMLALL